MSIHGIGMEQVVLHAPDDTTEGGDIASQYLVGVHAAQLMGDPDGCAQDVQEQAMMTRVLPELLIDQPQVPGDRAHGRCAHTFNVRVLLQQHEEFQQRGGRAGEHIIAARLERSVAYLEARVQRQDVFLFLGQDSLAEQLQQAVR